MVIDAENRVSFTVDRSIYLNGGLTLATCASGCSSLGNWSVGRIGTGIRTSLAKLSPNRTGGLKPSDYLLFLSSSSHAEIFFSRLSISVRISARGLVLPAKNWTMASG